MKTVHVVSAVIRRENEVFATQKGYGEWKGWWEFPGGKVEDGKCKRSTVSWNTGRVGNFRWSRRLNWSGRVRLSEVSSVYGMFLGNGDRGKLSVKRSAGFKMADSWTDLWCKVVAGRFGIDWDHQKRTDEIRTGKTKINTS